MNEGLRQYGVLVKTLLRNNFYNLLRARRNRVKTSKDRAKSAGLAVAAVFGVLAFVIFEITIAFSLASSAFNSGLYDEVVYVFLTAAQLIVFFFGILTVTGNLYFSKDNAILAPMPFRRSVVFSAKFTVAYLGELFISAVFVVPTTVTVGVGRTFHLRGVRSAHDSDGRRRRRGERYRVPVVLLSAVRGCRVCRADSAAPSDILPFCAAYAACRGVQTP